MIFKLEGAHLELPSLNKYLLWHWSQQHRFKKVLATHLFPQRVQLGFEGNKFPLKRAKIKVTSYRFQLIADDDNKAGCLKPLLDAMSSPIEIISNRMTIPGEGIIASVKTKAPWRSGIIVDDRSDNIEVTFEQKIDRANRRTVIEVTEIV